MIFWLAVFGLVLTFVGSCAYIGWVSYHRGVREVTIEWLAYENARKTQDAPEGDILIVDDVYDGRHRTAETDRVLHDWFTEFFDQEADA